MTGTEFRTGAAGRAAADCVWIVLLWAVPIALLRPFQNTPFVDDWVYGWSVEHLLRTGQLKILDVSANVNPAQVLWGALFCLPGGFSFLALRVSTWVASALSLCGLYLVLRQLGVGRGASLLSTAALAFYPVYFMLSYTFMTDIPFVCCLVWFCYGMVRAEREQRTGWLVLAAICACLAIATRVAGAALALALPAVLLGRGGSRWRRWPVVALVCVPLLFGVSLLWWRAGHIEVRADLTGIEGSPVWRLASLKYGFLLLPRNLVQAWIFCAGALGVALAPLAVGRFGRSIARRYLVAGGLCLLVLGAALALKVRLYVPLGPGETWSVEELGASAPLVPGYRTFELPARYVPVAVAVTTVLFAMAAGAAALRSSRSPESPLLWLLAALFLQTAVLWLYYDRYGLALLPPAIALLACGGAMAHPRLGAALVGIFAVLSLVGLRDHLEYNAALWSGVRYLESRGAPASEIDGGWAVNGWLQYAHPENAKTSPQRGRHGQPCQRFRITGPVPAGQRRSIGLDDREENSVPAMGRPVGIYLRSAAGARFEVTVLSSRTICASR